ncbi:hypothetical protein VULLAG_LOCUS20332 [Vulpes lagopus]
MPAPWEVRSRRVTGRMASQEPQQLPPQYGLGCFLDVVTKSGAGIFLASSSKAVSVDSKGASGCQNVPVKVFAVLAVLFGFGFDGKYQRLIYASLGQARSGQGRASFRGPPYREGSQVLSVGLKSWNAVKGPVVSLSLSGSFSVFLSSSHARQQVASAQPESRPPLFTAPVWPGFPACQALGKTLHHRAFTLSHGSHGRKCYFHFSHFQRRKLARREVQEAS